MPTASSLRAAIRDARVPGQPRPRPVPAERDPIPDAPSPASDPDAAAMLSASDRDDLRTWWCRY